MASALAMITKPCPPFSGVKGFVIMKGPGAPRRMTPGRRIDISPRTGLGSKPVIYEMRYMVSTPHVSAPNASAVRASAFLTGAAGALPSRTVVVLEAIKHAILAGELRPGQALVETDLAEVLGVSKTPVREALKTLAGAGLVLSLIHI